MPKRSSCCHIPLNRTADGLICSINIYLAHCYMPGTRDKAMKRKQKHNGSSVERTVEIIQSRAGLISPQRAPTKHLVTLSKGRSCFSTSGAGSGILHFQRAPKQRLCSWETDHILSSMDKEIQQMMSGFASPKSLLHRQIWGLPMATDLGSETVFSTPWVILRLTQVWELLLLSDHPTFQRRKVNFMEVE